MKTLRVFGWAVIFTVTLLLAACASHTPKVADTNSMSGPDATMTQPEQVMLTLEQRENALVIHQAWLDERELQLANREFDVERRENYLAINQAWLDEREMQFNKPESSASRPAQLATVGSPRTKVEGGRCYATVVYPAEYKTVAVVKPIEQPKGSDLPVLYQSVTEKVKVTDEQMRWEEILCEDSVTECRAIEIQRALSRGGYNPGPIDGVIGQQTMAAVNAFQKDFKLTVANYLTMETVRALNANY